MDACQSDRDKDMQEREQVVPEVNLIWIAVWLTVWIAGSAFTLYQLMKGSISELKKDIGGLRNDVSGLGEHISSLRERTARLEAKVGVLMTLPSETPKE